MPSKKISLEQEDARERQRFSVSTHYLIEWVNQLTYLIFFVVLLTVFSTLVNFMTLLNSNAVLSQKELGWLYAGMLSSIFLSIVLIIAIQYKKSKLERSIRLELK